MHERRCRHRDQRHAGGDPRARGGREFRSAAVRWLAEHGGIGFEKEAGELLHRIGYALGHAGSATGIEHVELVALGPHARGRRALALQIVVTNRALDMHAAIRRRAIIDLDQTLQTRYRLAHPCHAIGERGVIDQGLDVGVVEQVGELLIEVAVVDIDRHAAHFHRGEISLTVLGRVVQIHADPRMGAEPGLEQTLREPCGALFVVAPGNAACALRDRDGIGHGVGYRFPDRSVMRVDHVCCASPWQGPHCQPLATATRGRAP